MTLFTESWMGRRVGRGVGRGVRLQTLKTLHPATVPNSARQHSCTVSYSLESSSGKLLSLVHELVLNSKVLRCQKSPHSDGANVGDRVGYNIIDEIRKTKHNWYQLMIHDECVNLRSK